ncbi:PAS domain S-box protein [Crocinitomix sp.]|nr:PAS domain S-box protein [Crocinitomix sp.]
MKSLSPNIRRFLFAAMLIASINFIGVSLWLLNSLINKRENVANLTEQLELISTFENDVTNCLESFMEQDSYQMNQTFEKILNTKFDLKQFPNLKGISDEVNVLKKAITEANEKQDINAAEYGLAELRSYTISEQKPLFEAQKDLTNEINNYWNFTFGLIGLACLISLTLAIVGVFVYRSRKKITLLQTRNALFMKSIQDCVIVCDTHGKVVEYNASVQKIFGYNPTEAIGFSIDKFYGNEGDWQKVSSEIDSTNYFKAEIILKRKSGEDFLSYLSANAIYDNDELIGLSYKMLVHPDYFEIVDQHFKNQFANRTVDSYLEYKMVRSDGEEIWVGQNSRMTFNPNDSKSITGFFGVVRNLDEMKKVLMELQASELKYRELFDNSMEMIQSMTPEGDILYVNDAWKHRFGYEDDEIEKINLFDLIHEDSKVYCENLLSDILKIGEVSDDKEFSFKMVTKDGGIVAVKGSVGVKYSDNQVQSIQAFLRDVTEQAAIEEALKKSEENFRIIGASIHDVFFLYDYQSMTYDYISPNCEAVLGAKPEFFLEGKNYADHFVHPEDRKLVKAMEEKVKSGEIGNVEYRRIVGDEIRWVNEKWFPIINEIGDTVRISGVCRDITEMKGAYNTIYEQNLEISQSILYAKNIQESTLPNKEEVSSIFPESFVFYRAKDVLSGDLYIFESVLGDNDSLWPAFIVGDCTGHGVPGGVLSLLCSGLLTESLTSPKVNSPAEALDFVRSKLIRLFRSNPSKYILDGMDAAFCVLNREDMVLNFAGANLTCYVVRAEEVLEYKGDKQPVGYSSEMEPFVNYTIKIEEGDIIYLTTDGYVDQFGGPLNKKFLRKRFTKLLLDIKDLPMADQRYRIEKQFFDWKGDIDQTDDIALIAVKI